MVSLLKNSLETLEKTKQQAEELAGLLDKGDVLFLEGPLGVGKTEFARSLIRSLVSDQALVVPSPTFNLVFIYETLKGPLWHIDLYRLEEEDAKLEELGLEEAFYETISIVEWPQRLGKKMPYLDPLSITLSFDLIHSQKRWIEVVGSNGWKKRFEKSH